MFILPVTDSNQNFTAPYGKISFPNFPVPARVSDVTCRYLITAPIGERIQITSLHNLYTWRSACLYRSLQMFERLGSVSTKYCKFIIHQPYLSNGNSLLLVYKEKRLYSNSFSFQLHYQFIRGKMREIMQ